MKNLIKSFYRITVDTALSVHTWWESKKCGHWKRKKGESEHKISRITRAQNSVDDCKIENIHSLFSAAFSSKMKSTFIFHVSFGRYENLHFPNTNSMSWRNKWYYLSTPSVSYASPNTIYLCRVRGVVVTTIWNLHLLGKFTLNLLYIMPLLLVLLIIEIIWNHFYFQIKLNFQIFSRTLNPEWTFAVWSLQPWKREWE